MLEKKRPDQIQEPLPWVGWVETTLVTAAVTLLGAWLRPTDPFFIAAPFPWTILAPLLTGLRYGFAHGLTSALILIITLASAWRLEWLALHGGFPMELAVGLLAVGMLAGEFADTWRRRLLWFNSVNRYRQNRLDEFTRGYHLLKVSHDALEQRVAGTTQNLREALSTLRGEFLSSGRDDALPLWGFGARVLDLFARYGWVQVAGLYRVEGGRLVEEPVGVLGEAGEIRTDDPVLQDCLSQKKLVSIQGDSGEAGDRTSLLAAIPIVDVEGKVWAVVAVRQMLFVAFQGDNLHLLAIMGGHMGDIFTFGTRMIQGDTLGVREFRAQLRRSLADLRAYGLPVSLVSLVMENEANRESLASQILHQRRGLDQAIQLRRRGDGAPVILMLLNLTDEPGMEGYMSRLQATLDREHGGSPEELGISVLGRCLTRDHRAALLLDDLFAACDVASPEA